MCSAPEMQDEVSENEKPNVDDELLKMQARIDAKDEAIASLCNYCCFINGKLHTSEKSLSQRELDLEVSSAAFRKLQAQLRNQNEVIAEKEAFLRKLESARATENSELRSRIQFLQSYVDEAKSELERAEQGTVVDDNQDLSSRGLVSEELVECKAKIKSLENVTLDLKSRNCDLEEKTMTYETDMSASERTIERLTLDIESLQIESSSRSENQEMPTTSTLQRKK